MGDLRYGITKQILTKNIKTLREGGYNKEDALSMAAQFQAAQVQIRKSPVRR